MTASSPRDELTELEEQLSAVWSGVADAGWSDSAGASLHDNVSRLADLCASNDWDEIGDRTLDIEVYLSSFIDGNLSPNTVQIKVLQGLIEDLHRAALACLSERKTDPQPADRETGDKATLGDEIRHAYVLKEDIDGYPGLSAALGAQRFFVRPFTGTNELLPALDAHAPSVLIMQMQFVPSLREIDNKLSEGARAHGNRTAVVVLAEDNSLEERLSAMRAGADLYIPRPAVDATTVSRIQILVDEHYNQSFRVMIIDDDRQHLMLCDAILKRKGVNTRVCFSGKEGLACLAEFQPDLIIVDLHMPEMDGLQFTAQVRDMRDFFTIPIIFLSGETDPQSRYDALSLGGSDFLTKPIHAHHLIAAVWSRLKFSRELRTHISHPSGRDDETGLYRFARFLELGEEALKSGDDRSYLLQIELGNTAELEARYEATETLELQQHLAALVVSQFRGDDVIAAQRYFVFTALVRDVPEDQLGELAGRLLAQIGGRVLQFGKLAFCTSVSIGVVRLNETLRDINHAVRFAAFACREAAESGENQWFLGSEALTPSGQNEVLSQIAKTRVESDFADIRFQPLGPLCGEISDQFHVSMWARTSLDQPFLPVVLEPTESAAQLRLDLDRWLLVHGLEKAIAHQRPDTTIRIHLPVSVDTLAHEGTVKLVRDTLAELKLKPERLTLIVNIKSISGRADALEQLESLQKLGVRLCAAGVRGQRAELQVLERYRFAFAELDPALVSEHLSGKGSRSPRPGIGEVTRSIALLGMQTVMPDLRSAGDMALAWRSKVDYARGDFIYRAKSLPDYEFEQTEK
jgi:DNA-binding response OmpR family regulator/EAL domain-containing protein (putative c-di-GMP-specific phosphodiesterase class I)